MNNLTNNVENYLQKFGFDKFEIDLYQGLIKFGRSTALELSRKLKISRSRVYRVLDSLIEKKVVIQTLEDNRLVFEVISYLDLEKIIEDKKNEVDLLNKTLPLIQDQILALVGNEGDSKVYHYQGENGVQQAMFNSLKLDGKLCVVSGSNLLKIDNMRNDFEKKLKEYFLQKKIKVVELTNKNNLESKAWEVRYIDGQVLVLGCDMFIYNNVVLIFDENKEKLFADEIHSKELADLQRQHFEYVWKGAENLTFAL